MFDPQQPPALLVVEDNPTVQRFVALNLQMLGVRPYLAGSCREAEKVLHENPTVIGVLLDVQLPDKDGPATLKVLRDILPGIPVVFMTGDSTRLPPDHGADGMLDKPFAPGDLSEVVQRFAAVAR